jgi:hypothetical protein
MDDPQALDPCEMGTMLSQARGKACKRLRFAAIKDVLPSLPPLIGADSALIGRFNLVSLFAILPGGGPFVLLRFFLDPIPIDAAIKDVLPLSLLYPALILLRQISISFPHFLDPRDQLPARTPSRRLAGQVLAVTPREPVVRAAPPSGGSMARTRRTRSALWGRLRRKPGTVLYSQPRRAGCWRTGRGRNAEEVAVSQTSEHRQREAPMAGKLSEEQRVKILRAARRFMAHDELTGVRFERFLRRVVEIYSPSDKIRGTRFLNNLEVAVESQPGRFCRPRDWLRYIEAAAALPDSPGEVNPN